MCGRCGRCGNLKVRGWGWGGGEMSSIYVSRKSMNRYNLFAEKREREGKVERGKFALYIPCPRTVRSCSLAKNSSLREVLILCWLRHAQQACWVPVISGRNRKREKRGENQKREKRGETKKEKNRGSST